MPLLREEREHLAPIVNGRWDIIPPADRRKSIADASPSESLFAVRLSQVREVDTMCLRDRWRAEMLRHEGEYTFGKDARIRCLTSSGPDQDLEVHVACEKDYVVSRMCVSSGQLRHIDPKAGGPEISAMDEGLACEHREVRQIQPPRRWMWASPR